MDKLSSTKDDVVVCVNAGVFRIGKQPLNA